MAATRHNQTSSTENRAGIEANTDLPWLQRHPSQSTARAWNFSCPTDIQGEFARSMSQITTDPSSATQGSLSRSNDLRSKLFNQLQLALAVKMGLNGPQQIKEQALHNVLTSKSARGDMKQILQSRQNCMKTVWNQAGSMRR